MTFPSADSDKLIRVDSRNLSPSVPVLICRSLPAKSTIFCNIFLDSLILINVFESERDFETNKVTLPRFNLPTLKILMIDL